MKEILWLSGLSRLNDAAVLLVRWLVGAFLVWGVWDNIVSSERMAEFAAFMAQFGFPAPAFLALVSVYAQFVCGILLILGLLTRWAGLFMAFNFIVGFVMVHGADDFRAQFPALILIVVSLQLAAGGGGRYAIDRFFD